MSELLPSKKEINVCTTEVVHSLTGRVSPVLSASLPTAGEYAVMLCSCL